MANIRDLAPWNWGKGGVTMRGEENPFEVLQRRMNSLFEDFFSPGFGLEQVSERFGGFSPKINVTESETDIRVEAELPGLEEKDIDISLTRDALTLRGEKRTERESREGENQYCSERSYGAFSRMIWLRGAEIDEDRVKAEFRKGVLHITLPKTKGSQSQVKRISVQSS